MRPRRGEGVRREAARAVYREGSNCGDWRARHGAHEKHVVHGCDAGRVETQRLVERLRALPSRNERHANGAMGAGRREGARHRRRKQRAGNLFGD